MKRLKPAQKVVVSDAFYAQHKGIIKNYVKLGAVTLTELHPSQVAAAKVEAAKPVPKVEKAPAPAKVAPKAPEKVEATAPAKAPVVKKDVAAPLTVNLPKAAPKKSYSKGKKGK